MRADKELERYVGKTPKDFEHISEMSSCEAYRDFFKGYTKFPRFKSKKHSVPKFYQDNVKIQFTDTHVKFEGFATSKKKNK